jgi:hypothetical protein
MQQQLKLVATTLDVLALRPASLLTLLLALLQPLL